MLNRLVRMLRPHSSCLAKHNERSLYRLADGNKFWLDPSRYLDRCLINEGIFEPVSIRWVERLVRQGDVVLDVGANIGYYSVMLGQKVGLDGKVLAFEPTANYRRILEKNLAINELDSLVSIMSYGLSDAETKMEIAIGDCSATLHWVEEMPPRTSEVIELHQLDVVFPTFGLTHLDFIKIDIDGHEPAFIKGARETINRYQPVLLLEVNHANYLAAGCTAWQFYDDLTAVGYILISEKTGKPFSSQLSFLRECGNFDHSANILVATGLKSLERIEAARAG